MGLKISDMIIAILVIGLFISVITLIMAQMATKYTVTDPSGNLTEYTQTLAPLNANIKAIQAKQDNVSSSSKLDVIGDYFNQGYSALKLTGESFTVMNNLSNKAIKDSQLGPAATIFQAYGGVIIVVLIFIAILLTVLVRAEI